MKKAQRMKAVAQLMMKRSGGDIACYFARDMDVIRRELLSLPGIGHSTADNILLYAGQVPIYMVDTFTMRVLTRHGIAEPHANESQIQELIHQELTPDEEPYGAELFQKMQNFLVRLGRDFCDKSRPDCFCCPLNIYLPEGGARGLSKKAVQRDPQPVKVSAAPQKPQVSRPVEILTDLNETERRIVAAISEEPLPIDNVISVVQLPVHVVRATIAVLQMKKLVRQVEGNQVRRISMPPS
jgi:adenine-specific DNA glycosylase